MITIKDIRSALKQATIESNAACKTYVNLIGKISPQAHRFQIAKEAFDLASSKTAQLRLILVFHDPVVYKKSYSFIQNNKEVIIALA